MCSSSTLRVPDCVQSSASFTTLWSESSSCLGGAKYFLVGVQLWCCCSCSVHITHLSKQWTSSSITINTIIMVIGIIILIINRFSFIIQGKASISFRANNSSNNNKNKNNNHVQSSEKATTSYWKRYLLFMEVVVVVMRMILWLLWRFHEEGYKVVNNNNSKNSTNIFFVVMLRSVVWRWVPLPPPIKVEPIYFCTLDARGTVLDGTWSVHWCSHNTTVEVSFVEVSTWWLTLPYQTWPMIWSPSKVL